MPLCLHPNYSKLHHFTTKYNYVKKPKTLSLIKRKAYRGLWADVERKSRLKKDDIMNIVHGRSKNPKNLLKIRTAATLLIEKHQKDLKSI